MEIKGFEARNHLTIDEDFFDIDKENNVAKITLSFETPKDIFDTNYMTKTPILNDEFFSWMQSAFSLVSSKYKIDLTIIFDDMGKYSEEDLKDIFLKNMRLEFKSHFGTKRKKNKVAFFLIGIGVVFFSAMLLLSNLWESESIWKQIFVYISDIATTVTFWEAMTILIVDSAERSSYMKNLATRFSGIHFKTKS